MVFLQEVLRDHLGVMWVDTPFTGNRAMLDTVLQRAVASEGVFMLKPTGHSVYAATHPSMYSYLPADTERLKTTRMWSRSVMLLYNTNATYHSILHWWYLCALDQRCIAPPNLTQPCPLMVNVPNRDQFGVYYPDCHRYDQSALNILLDNYFQHRTWVYTMQAAETFIHTHSTEEDARPVKSC